MVRVVAILQTAKSDHGRFRLVDIQPIEWTIAGFDAYCCQSRLPSPVHGCRRTGWRRNAVTAILATYHARPLYLEPWNRMPLPWWPQTAASPRKGTRQLCFQDQSGGLDSLHQPFQGVSGGHPPELSGSPFFWLSGACFRCGFPGLG